MTGNAPPSMNPAEKYSLTGLLNLALRKHLQGVDDMLPAKVVSYDRATNMVTVQPAINMVTTLNQIAPRGQITVPAFQAGAGGFVISVPINAGDTGWIKANDKDISLYAQQGQVSSPNTHRQHSFEDGIFIPDTMMRGVTLNGEDSSNFVIQNESGTVRIALWSDRVKITAPQIILDTPLLTVTGGIQAGTNLSYSNTAVFNGQITTTADVIAGSGTHNVSLQSHTHSGVTMGGDNTGVPN